MFFLHLFERDRFTKPHVPVIRFRPAERCNDGTHWIDDDRQCLRVCDSRSVGRS